MHWLLDRKGRLINLNYVSMIRKCSSSEGSFQIRGTSSNGDDFTIASLLDEDERDALYSEICGKLL